MSTHFQPAKDGGQRANVRLPAAVCSQLGLFAEDKTIAQRFEAWKATAGGRQVLNRAYRIAAGFVPRFQRTGQRVSMKLVWELLRDKLDWLRAGLKRRGITLPPDNGFMLNNDFTAYVARHILEHKPEWAGLFELRGVGSSKVGVRKRVIVIEESSRVRGNVESRHGGIERRTSNSELPAGVLASRRQHVGGSVSPGGETAENGALGHQRPTVLEEMV